MTYRGFTVYIYIYNVGGTVSDGGEQQCVHRLMVPPGGTEVDIMGVDRLLQSMTGQGDRVRSRWELLALLYSYNGLYGI